VLTEKKRSDNAENNTALDSAGTRPDYDNTTIYSGVKRQWNHYITLICAV